MVDTIQHQKIAWKDFSRGSHNDAHASCLHSFILRHMGSHAFCLAIGSYVAVYQQVRLHEVSRSGGQLLSKALTMDQDYSKMIRANSTVRRRSNDFWTVPLTS